MGGLLSAVISTTALASDRLQSSAQITVKAAKGLLLDVTRAGQRLVAVGDQGVVIWSDDDGVNWQQAPVPVSVMLTAVSFINDTTGWAVGHDGVVLKTTDAGQSWQVQLDGVRLNQLRVEQFESWVNAGGDEHSTQPLEELELYLDDALVAQEEGPSQPLLDVWFRDDKLGFALGAYGLLLKTEDGGQTWHVRSHRVPNPDRFHLNAMLAADQALYIAGEAGLLFKSTDMGESWVALESPYEGSFFSLGQWQNQLLALGLRGHLFSSEDQGESWQAVDVPVKATLTGVASSSKQLTLVGLGGLTLQGNSLDQLALVDESDRRAWSAIVATDSAWVLVGERGVKRLTKAAGAGHE